MRYLQLPNLRQISSKSPTAVEFSKRLQELSEDVGREEYGGAMVGFLVHDLTKVDLKVDKAWMLRLRRHSLPTMPWRGAGYRNFYNFTVLKRKD